MIKYDPVLVSWYRAEPMERIRICPCGFCRSAFSQALGINYDNMVNYIIKVHSLEKI
jgi:hypothetical protein